MYAKAAFEQLNADAVTVSPSIWDLIPGKKPFGAQNGKMDIIWLEPANEGHKTFN